MYQINIKDIEPQNTVTIEYNDSNMGQYEMNLVANKFVHVYGARDGIESLNTPGHYLTKTDLKEFLEDHTKEANLRLSRGVPTGIKSITVDDKLVFEPKMITYEKMPSDCIDVSKVHPNNELKIKFAKPIYIEYEFNVKENKYLEIRPEKDGLIYHNTRNDPVTPKKLQEFMNMYVKVADDMLKKGKTCPIDSITVDGKLVFESKMLQYGKGITDSKDPSKEKAEHPHDKPMGMQKEIHTVKPIDINLDAIHPKNEVIVTYKDSNVSTLTMNLAKNSYTNEYIQDGKKQKAILSSGKLTQRNLKILVEDHVYHANRLAAIGRSSGIQKIEVDHQLVYDASLKVQPTIQRRENEPQKDKIYRVGQIDFQNDTHGWFLTQAPNAEKAKEFGARMFNQLEHNKNPQKYESPYIPVILESYDKKEELMPEWKLFKILKANDKPMPYEVELQQKQEKAIEKDGPKQKIFRIGRLDSQDKINGWKLIEAPTQEKALRYATRLFNQEENNERPYSFESPYTPVVLNTYHNKEEMGYGWKDITPIKAHDNPMPYEVELQKIHAKEAKLAQENGTKEMEKRKPSHKLGIHRKRSSRDHER